MVSSRCLVSTASILARGEPFRLFDPTATYRLVQIRVRLEELGLSRDIRELGIEQRLFGVGHFQINGRPFPVAKVGQVAEAPQRLDVLRPLLAYLPELRPIDQRVLDVLESADNRLFVGVEG